MKIKHVREPPFYRENDEVCQLIRSFKYKDNLNDFCNHIDQVLPLTFNDTSQLLDWAEVLDRIDGYIAEILQRYLTKLVFVEDQPVTEDSVCKSTEDSAYDSYVSHLKRMLVFTKELLLKTTNKEVYNSADRLIELLRAFDDELLFLSLAALEALAIPSMTHRCDREISMHSTILHKNNELLQPFFSLIETAVLALMDTSLINLASPTFLPTQRMSLLNLDLSDLSKYSKWLALNKLCESEQIEEFPSIGTYISGDVREEHRPLKIILEEPFMQQFPNTFKMLLMMSIRFKRMVHSASDRRKMIITLLQSMNILLSCHSDANVLNQFFNDKLNLIKDCIYLVKTGPGSTEYRPELMPLDAHLAAVRSLNAIVGARDITTTSSDLRFPFILFDLGLSRGSYMGMVPCLLRSSIGYLISASESKSFDVNRLVWIENLFSLLMALVNGSNTLAALTENGLISSLLLFVSSRKGIDDIEVLVYIEVMVMEMLEVTINSHSPALAHFKEEHGFILVFQRLHSLVAECIDKGGKIPHHYSILLQAEFSLLSMYIQEARHDSSDHAQSQFYKSQEFHDCFLKIFSCPCSISNCFLSLAVSLLFEVLNSDPSPPNMVNIVLNNGIAKQIVDLVKQKDLEGNSEMILSTINFVSAICLSNAGLDLVQESNPFTELFAIFHNELLYYPNSWLMMHDLPHQIGGAIEELLRHYPVLLDMCFSSLMQEVVVIQGLISSINVSETKNLMESGLMFPFYCSTAILQCLERILMRAQAVEKFCSMDGLSLLLTIYETALQPPKYFLSNLSSTVEPTISSLGFSPIANGITKCFLRMADSNSKAVFNFVLENLESKLRLLEEACDVYWKEHGEGRLSSDGFKSLEPARGLRFLLESVSTEPLQNLCHGSILPDYLNSYCNTLQRLEMIDYLLEIFATSVQNKITQKISEGVLESLNSESVMNLFRKVFFDVYIPSQLEIARARGSLSDSTEENCVKNHPIYHILVTAPDSIIVRESFEDNAKKVCKVGRGVLLEAFERKCNASGTLKYRTDLGWISVFRGFSSIEAQIHVVEVTNKSFEDRYKEMVANGSLYSVAKSRNEFNRLANVSARRGGFHCLFHLHITMRLNVFGLFSKNLFSRNTLFGGFASPDKVRANKYAHKFIPLCVDLVDSMLPQIPAEMLVRRSCNLCTIDMNDKASQSDDEMIHARVMKDLRENFFINIKIPSLSQFSQSAVNLTVRAIDIFQAFLLEGKKSRGDLNSVLLLQFFRDSRNVIDRLLSLASHLFLSCLNPFEHCKLVEDDYRLSQFMESEDFSAFPVEFFLKVEDELGDEPIEQSSEKGSTDIDSALFVEFKKLLKSWNQRRNSALGNLDVVLDFFKTILHLVNAGPNSYEHFLQSSSNEDHYFDPYAFKREFVIIFTRYLYPLFSHPLLFTLPPSTIKNVLEVFSITCKLVFDSKSFQLKSLRQENSSVTNGAASAMNRRARPRAMSFTPNESTISQLQDMGFSRGSIMQVMSSLRTNNLSALVPILLEVPFGSENVPGSQNPSVDSVEESNAAEATIGSSSDNAEEINIREEAKSKTEEQLTNLLLVPRSRNRDDRELEEDQELLCLISRYLGSTLEDIFVRLIEYGYSKSCLELDPEISSNNSHITREVFTVMVMNQMMRTMERFNSSTGALKLTQLCWLYRRANRRIKSPSSNYSYRKLYALLHGIVFLLTNRTPAANKSMSCPELMILLISYDSRYHSLHGKLVEFMKAYVSDPLQRNERFSGSKQTDLLSWLCPAYLLLDCTVQPYIADPTTLAAGLDIFQSYASKSFRTFGISGADIMSDDTLENIYMYSLRKAPLTRSESAKLANSSELGSTGVDAQSSGTTIDLVLTAPQHMPLVNGSLSTERAIECAQTAIYLLEFLPENAATSAIVGAVFQFLVHSTRNDAVRREVVRRDGYRLIAKCKVSFSGYASIAQTIFTQLLEDSEYLTHAMKSTMRLCYLRLSKQKASKVTLRNFVEVVSPLVFRNQAIFMDSVRALFAIEHEDNQVTLKLLEQEAFKRTDVENTEKTLKYDGSPHLQDRKRLSSSHDDRAHKRIRADSHTSDISKKKLDGVLILSKGLQQKHRLVCHEIADKLLRQIVIKQMSSVQLHDSGKISSDLQHLLLDCSSFTITDLLFTVADLSTSMQYFANAVLSFDITTFSNPKNDTILQNFSVVDSVSGELLKKPSFLQFVVHSLLLSLKLTKNYSSNGKIGNSMQQEQRDEILKLIGDDLKNACFYFIAALSSRAGDVRRTVLGELLNIFKAGRQLDYNIGLQPLIIYCEIFVNLLHPPSHWSTRDAFILHAKDLLSSLNDMNASQIFSNILCLIPMDKPLAMVACLAVTTPLDILLKRSILDSEGELINNEKNISNATIPKASTTEIDQDFATDQSNAAGSSTIANETSATVAPNILSEQAVFADHEHLMRSQQLDQSHSERRYDNLDDRSRDQDDEDEDDEDEDEDDEDDDEDNDDADDEDHEQMDERVVLESVDSDDEHDSDGDTEEPQNTQNLMEFVNPDENAFARRFGGRHRLGEDDDEAGEEEDDEEEEEDDDADDQHDHHRDDPYENDVPDEDDDVQPVEDESIADEAVGEDEEIDANDAMYFENHNDHADDAENIMNAEEGQDVEEENDDDEDQLEMQSMEEDDQEQNMGNLYSMYPESADDENDSTEAENALLQSLGDNSFARNRVDGSRGRTNRLEILSAQQASDHRTQAARSSARFVLHNIAQRVGHPYSNAGLNDLLYEFDLGRPSGDGASSAMINFHNMLSGDVSSGFRSSREGNSFTLTFGSNRPISAGDLSSRLGPAVRAANAPTPHPLLSIQENRRPRTGPLASFSSEIYSNLLSQGSSDFSSFGERSRGHALGFSATTPRRRSLGPIVSDRRWGTDIGELDPTGTRLNVLFEAVENAVKSDKSVEVENRDELQTKFRGKFCESYQSEDVNDESKKASSEPIVNGGSDNVVLQQTLRTDLLSSEESKDEGILQETKEDSAAVLTNPSESTVEMLRRSGEVSAFSNTPLAQITITSPANLNEVLNSPDLPVSDRVDVSDHANETSLLDSTSNGMEVASNSMDVAFTTESADSTLIQTDSTNEFANAENTAFVLSLPLFLREEVFLTADQDFLRGLPNDMRQEALQLREERAIGFQAGTYGGLSTEAEPRLEQNLENVSEVQRATESRGSNEAEDHPQNLENSTEPIEPKQEPKSELIDEGSLRILLNGDRKTDSIPFGSFIVTRLMNCFFRSGKPKWQRGFLRLLTSYCSYKIGRKWIIGALLSSVLDRDDSSSVVKMIQKIPFENSLTDNYRAIYVLEEESVTQASKEAGFSVLLLRRVIHCISYIIRKTDQLAWYDIVSAEHSSIENNLPWMFGSIISLLEANRYSSSVYLDHVIHLIEQITAPLSRLSVTEANYLVSKQLPHTTSTLETIQEEENSENDPTPTPKRQRLSSMVTGANLAKESKENDSDTSVLDNNNSKLLPFPVMSSSNARALAAAVSQSNYGGSSKKRFIRIMQNLALADCNLYLFLEQLAEAGTGLAARAFIEFTNLHNTLALLEQGSQSAAEAMALPEISTPKALYENQLLNVLKLMTSLRSQKGLKSEELSETIISDYMRKINANHLWETLCTCLDIVRDLEGIDDGNPDENNNDLMESHQQTASDVSSRSAAPDTSNFAKEDVKEDKSKVSPLIMRFMALIECFLTVCSVTILVKPSQVGTQSSNKKRKSEAPLDVASTDFVSPQRTSSTPLFMRTSSTLPGSRFRQTAEFMQMQLELGESEISQHLIEFARKNRLLLHVMLRQNVHLLETTFSPLILVPKCRQLLHFDIKRAYFKAKLRRMRQSSSRNSYNNMLRLVVRRSRVFEDSFTFMRSRTTDELRSRLSVSFHGEDGMDAGGLTREWYTVLSREIFNPDYALFTTAGDTVTFQPNPFSKVNNEHLSYFKFVGRVIGKAICDGQLLDAHFTRSFYKHILGIPVSVADLEAIEPDYYKSLKQILESSLEDLGLDLTFTAETNEFGKIEEVNLIPGGDKIVVTDENKHDYVKLIAHHRMTSAIRSQIDSFLEGFHELVPPELISIFDAQELELLISGLPDIDMDDLRSHTEYSGYKASDPLISQFWSVLRSFSKQDKALFLQFVTGTSKVPLDGFQALYGADGIKLFNIHKAYGGDRMLPQAHTCFNQLDLPEYSSEENLREKLLIAIREGSEGFGFA